MNLFRNFRPYLISLARNKMYTFITVFGFAVALMFVILLTSYVIKEYQVDQFHVKKDRIFKLGRKNDYNFAPVIAERLKNNFPEIESYTRIYEYSCILNRPGGEKIRIQSLLADSSFFNIFSFPLIEGDPNVIFDTEFSMVISQSLANKLFGSQSALNKIVSDGRFDFRVSGVMKDFPENTHFIAADAIINFPVLAKLWDYSDLLVADGNSSFSIYFLAYPNTNLPDKSDESIELLKKDYWVYRDGYSSDLVYEPITDVYLSEIGGRGIKQNSKRWIFIVVSITLIILVLSVINYINLTIAQTGTRARETAINKLLGCSNFWILRQRLIESVFLCTFSFVLAFLMAMTFQSVFNKVLNCHVLVQYDFTVIHWFASFVLILLIGFISGIVPALISISINPLNVLKGTFRLNSKVMYFKILIGFQFFVVIGLLASSWIIYLQTNYLKNHNVGFSTENILFFNNSLSPNDLLIFKEEIAKIPGVGIVSCVAGSPLSGGVNFSFKQDGVNHSFQYFRVDTQFFSLMNLQVTPCDNQSKGIWLNESGVKALGLPKLPTIWHYATEDVPIRGVVKDFAFNSLEHPIGPAYLILIGDEYPWQVFIKIESNQPLMVAESISKVYKNVSKGIPFEFQFVDEALNKQYEKQEKIGKLVFGFTVLAIIISIMGIFAMSLFFIQQRAKEISIRKINGALVRELTMTMLRDFIIWATVAFLLITPLSIYILDNWLNRFAYHISMPWGIFPIAGVITLTFTIMAIGGQIIAASMKNPVENLRYE